MIIIEGITSDGHKFRPSNWAQRMSGSLSTFKNHRIFYSPLLRPSSRNGAPCLIIDEALAEAHPDIYGHILAFAEKNNLRISEE
ncbi:MAG: acetyltransferase [Legionellales bacterium]|nr:acetyltransferase [Legionellales bacterium]